jgi:predicted  nucleic acid-binding Zn-ribbon protein
MVKSKEEIGQLFDYNKLSAIHPLRMPKIEKKDIPSFINCPKYEKAKNNLNQKMERYQAKVDRLADDIQQLENKIEDMRREQQRWKSQASTFLLDREDVRAVERQNHAADMFNSYIDKISSANEKRDDLIDKHTEAVEEAQEKLQELQQEALAVIDEDIVAVLDRCTKIVEKMSGSQNTEDLFEAIDICLIELRIYAMFEDLIEDNDARKDCRERIAEVNQMFSTLCANDHILKYLVDLYQRNLKLVQTNAEIFKQEEQVLASVDQAQLTTLKQPIDTVLTEQINTTFEYKGIVDPAQLDEIIGNINKTVVALNQNIVKAKAAVTAAGDFAKTGVSTDQEAKTLLSSMKSNVEEMKNDIISQDHFSVLLLDEALIDDFYQKDGRSAVTALRKNLIGTIGEENLDSLVKGEMDRFSLEKAENAIKQANLLKLQAAIDKIPAHIKKMEELIASANSDIQEAGKVPQQNADALSAELGKKYITACFPLFGWISAIGILGRVKAFKSAFCSTNQIYQNLANALLAKNSKMTKVVMIIGAILGIGGTVTFFVLNLGNSVAVNAGVPGAVLLFYGIAVLILLGVGKKLRSFLQK